MKAKKQPLDDQHRVTFENLSGIYNKRRIQPVIRILFRLACWSFVAWVVWNHALSNFLNFGGINLPQSFGVGILLCFLSLIFEDTDSHSDTRDRPTIPLN